MIRLLGNVAALEELRTRYPFKRRRAGTRCTSTAHGGGQKRLFRCHRERGHEGTHIAHMRGRLKNGVQLW